METAEARGCTAIRKIKCEAIHIRDEVEGGDTIGAVANRYTNTNVRQRRPGVMVEVTRMRAATAIDIKEYQIN